MSTKMLQVLIEAHRNGTTLSTETICKAERELDAIRKAARVVSNGDTESADPAAFRAAMSGYHKAMDLLEAIAKED